jgi:hypothetical protein
MANSGFGDLADCILQASLDSFGEEVVYLPKTGGQETKCGIFDNRFEQVDPDTEMVVASNQVTLGVKLSDFSNPIAKNDKFIIREITYRVIDVQEDGVAGARVFLHKGSF